MQTVVLTAPGRLALGVAERPRPQAGEALIRVRQVGVCGTDLHAYAGRQPYFTYPRILGHEIAAEVVEVNGEAAGWQPGARCVVLPYLACGACGACRQGKPNCCTSLRVLGVHTDGALREHLTVPVTALVRAEGLSPTQMALVENQSIGAHAVGRAQLQPGEWALVVGAGPIGIGAIQFAQLAGARVIVLEADDRRLQFCQDVLGVRHLLHAADDPAGRLAALTGGELAHAVLEATGNPHAMMAAFGHVAHGGRLVLISVVQAEIAFHDPDFHRREMAVLSSRNATRADFDQVIAALRAGRIVSEALVTHRAPLAEVPGQFAGWANREGGVIKALVEV